MTGPTFVQAVLKALREREAQLLTVQALEADIAKKQKALDTLEEQARPNPKCVVSELHAWALVG